MKRDNELGNGVEILKREGDEESDLERRVKVGMVGINVKIKVKIEY